jgi:hypothetical protein
LFFQQHCPSAGTFSSRAISAGTFSSGVIEQPTKFELRINLGTAKAIGLGIPPGAHEARAGIGEWMIFYNTRRFHQALGYKTPMAVWSAGNTAMDMPLRLDNARALPTCPQPQQQMQTAIAA